MCIISITHKDCVGAISSYPPFLHQSKILWLPDTVKTILQVWQEFCTEEGKCCSSWFSRLLPTMEMCNDILNSIPSWCASTKHQDPSFGKDTGCDVKDVDLLQLAKRQHSLPAAHRKGSWKSILDPTGPHHGEGLRTKPFYVIILRHYQQQRGAAKAGGGHYRS